MNRSDQRKYTPLATQDVKNELERLLGSTQSEYREAMYNLGRHLGAELRPRLGRKAFAVVTTPEDADFLTRGLLEELPSQRARLACYWTQRISTSVEGRDVATIVQEFVEPMPRELGHVIIAKSIISSGCIIRTNLDDFLSRANPEHIIIAAPVMLHGANDVLKAEFAPRVSKRFEFVTFAVDAKRDAVTRDVVPGVGGRVEKRLGLDKKSPRFSPALVRQRRSSMAVTA